MAVDFTGLSEGGINRLGISTSNTLVKVHANIYSGNVIYTITTHSTITSSSTQVSLSSNLDATFLEKGTYLTFGVNNIVINESILIGTTPQTVQILTNSNIASGSTAQTYAMVTLPSTDVNNSEEVELIDATTHSHSMLNSTYLNRIATSGILELGGVNSFSEQTSQERVARSLTVTIPLIIRPEDRGYFYHVLPVSMGQYGSTLNVFIAVPAGNNKWEYTIGNAFAVIDSDANPVDEIRRPTVRLIFRPPWVKTTLYEQEKSVVRTIISNTLVLAGVAHG